MKSLFATLLMVVSLQAAALLPPDVVQRPCYKTDLLVETLSTRHKETLYSTVRNKSGTSTVIYVNKTTGTFTIAEQYDSGMTCVIDIGVRKQGDL
jgi:hypothetical protein